jgi:two-component sensor histidine kinase/DNA-binding NarL/FixJ family response regulator
MLNVLVAEDDLMIADMIEESLIEAGYKVCGIARTVPDAVRLGQLHRPDLAVIDMKLADGGLGTEIVDQLLDGPRIGVLYASGNTNLIDNEAEGDAYIAKPYLNADLMRALKLVEQIVSDGFATPPFPRGFHLLREKIWLGGQKPRPKEPSIADFVAQNATLLRQQAAIAGFGSFALRQSDLLTVLTEAAKVCAEGLNVPFCKVCRYRAEENDLLIEAGFGWKDGVVGHVVSRADESSPQGRAFTTGRPAICNDLRTDTNFKLPAFYAAHGVISTVDVIIKGDGKPYGVLEIDNNEQHDYDERDINFLTAFANVLAEAVATSARLLVLNATIAEKDRLLDQKKVLAEELQHRVRNNMQLVYGMLSRQLDDTKDAAEQRGIRSIARRVSTLAQVYDNLLGNGMTRTTDFGSYAKSLCANIAEVQASAITLTCTSEPLLLDLDTVTALGIVLAELVTNSYDHGFPAGYGTITVALVASADADNLASLTISDNGKGFVPAFNSKRHGLGLVRRLVEQARGTMVVESGHGTVWVIKFPSVPLPREGHDQVDALR